MRIRIAVVGVCTALLLTGCTSASPDAAAGRHSLEAKNGAADAAARRAVPRGRGSALPDDFNGDGLPDLVLNDLVKAEGDTYGDDAGIGIVYGTAGGAGVDPSVRQLLTPRERAAKVDGVLPAAFEAEAACDLDGDGYGDLIITTDPPYNGIGMPPVPLQILFGGPTGLTGRAVVLKIPAVARAGNEWPDHPVCGDFDGDGKTDLAVTASGGQVSFLRGPFTRAGAPRSAAAPVPAGGPVLAAPEPKADASADGSADVNGDGYDDLVVLGRARTPGRAARGRLLPGGPKGFGGAGATYGFKATRLPPAPKLPAGRGRTVTEAIRPGFGGGLATRTHRGETTDVVAVYAAGGRRPVTTFSTSVFLAGASSGTPTASP
ncbi:FG-GAP repeat domain-containing protein [Streptomyces paludis]|uniref:VCBS repeat-containing protein n=1 Tax=Streptomyces paludis TaxID=2282738 RepID=A0A345HRD2_9ACTN|nr:VCBS repeat-containing protein [Streptomyces paludis]AXG79256.1 VCBS repeat-containing protein [Streptomyces paludis]